MPTTEPLLSVEDLNVDFDGLQAVRGVDFTVQRGETLGIVGESGSGKSVTALSILRLIAPPGRITAGRILFSSASTQAESQTGRADLLKLSEKSLRAIRGSRIGMVFQDPLTSLNPTLTIGEQIVETIREHRSISKKDAREEAETWLRQVHMTLPDRRLRQYPFELSGGMRQRAMIAMAFSCRPELLIADEPTTALDVTVQAQILDLMDELGRDHGTSVILITHDLGIVAERCDNVAVMYAGQIIEFAPTHDLFSKPRHPYTQALLDSLPDWRRPRTSAPLPALAGQPPSVTSSPPGCPFAPRCPQVMDICLTSTPPATKRSESGGYVKCLKADADDKVSFG